MNKHEFEERIKKEEKVTDAEYEEIEFVYTWHPAIPANGGKEMIAAIFDVGGMVVIRSMKDAAAMAQELDGEIRAEMNKLEKLKRRRERLKNGDMSYERCRKDVERVFDLIESIDEIEREMGKLAGEYGFDAVQEAREDMNI